MIGHMFRATIMILIMVPSIYLADQVLKFQTTGALMTFGYATFRLAEIVGESLSRAMRANP